ncbi:MAG: hypothetical protein ACPF9N_05145 [Flavobacteriaceae bacterium]
MKQFLYLAFLLPGFIFSQASITPTWEYSVVSDLPFHTPMNNEFKAAAEELMAKKWTQQILNILLENTIQQTAFEDKMLFAFQIVDRASTRKVNIPISVQKELIFKIKKGDSEALERFSKETKRWILRYI